MNTRQVSILAIVMATGCAHGQAESHHAGASAREESAADRQVARGEAETGETQAVRDEQAGDHVDVPARRGDRGQLATTGQELPADGKTDAQKPASAAAYGTDADNTRVNERDRASSALTPMDQSESESDRALVQTIRKAVIADDSLSFTAKNVKIITRDGQVTLRGAVNNAREKATIEKAATAAAGAKRVTNELEVSN